MKTALYLDPPSHHFLNDRLFVVNDGRLNGDHMNAPYAYLQAFFTARGIEVHTADFLPEKETAGRNIYVSMGMLDKYQMFACRKDTIISGFFALECPIVEPSLFHELGRVQKFFKRIFSWSDSPSLERFVGVPLRCQHFCWPQSFDDVHEQVWSKSDRKFLVMINSNKLPRINWQELYTERMRAVEFFSRTQEIDLYGKGWDEPSIRVGKTWVPWTARKLQHALKCRWQNFRPDPLLQGARRVYQGTAESKSETLGQYTFALCFENMILKGWITEKIFDCFFSGTIPVYWGAPEIEEYIPTQCFIDMRRHSGYADLKAFLKSLSAKDIQGYKEAARDFLRSPQFHPFSKHTFAQLFARIIEEDTGIRL